jgi:hypothetical protein
MGYMAHNAIIVTSWQEKGTEAAHGLAVGIFPKDQVSPLSDTVTNGYRTFAIFPDGSKEGWEDSNEGDKNRDAFMAALDKFWEKGLWVDVVEVRFGGDLENPEIVRRNKGEEAN